MKTNLSHVLRGIWNSGVKNFLIAVALGLLGGATLSSIDRTALDDCTQEALASSRYLP